MRNKVTIVGAGNVGASCALWLAQANIADLVLVDIPQAETMPVGKALDLLQAGPIVGYDSRVVGTANGSYDGTENSDLIINLTTGAGGSVEFSLPDRRQQTSYLTPRHIEFVRIVELPRGMLKAQIEQLLACIAKTHGEILVGEIAHLLSFQRDCPPASRTCSGSAACDWRDAWPRAPPVRSLRQVRT